MTRARLAILIVAGIVSAALAAAAASGKADAERAARSWLAVVDAGEYGKSWDEAAAFFRKSLTKPQWEEALKRVRAPLGQAGSRSLLGAKAATDLPGAPPGEYVVIQFETDFENGRGKVETVTPMKDPDGIWRVSGYYIK